MLYDDEYANTDGLWDNHKPYRYEAYVGEKLFWDVFEKYVQAKDVVGEIA